jgi:hypothetical protein
MRTQAHGSNDPDNFQSTSTYSISSLVSFFNALEAMITTLALTSADLLSKVNELGKVSKSELVRCCGYVSTRKDGSERLNFSAFYKALLEAKGLCLASSNNRRGGPAGRKLSNVAKVHFNGNLMVGKAYTTQLELRPGDQFEIKLGHNLITLVPLSAPEDNP